MNTMGKGFSSKLTGNHYGIAQFEMSQGRSP